MEADAPLLRRLLQRDAYLARLVDQRWIFLAALDPDSNALVELQSTTSRPYQADSALRVSRGPSRRYYEGRRDHLPFATLEADRALAP